jgi:hypothetical protein
MYLVLGVIKRLSGSGPSATDLADYVFSNVSLTPDGVGSWTSPDLYTGNVTLFGYHELSGYVVPEPGTVSLLALGGLFVARRRR